MNIQLLDSPRFVHEAGSLGWACRYGLRVQRPALVLEHRGRSLLIGESLECSGDSYELLQDQPLYRKPGLKC